MIMFDEMKLTIKHENDEIADEIVSRIKANTQRDHRMIYYGASNKPGENPEPFILGLHDLDGELVAGLTASRAWNAMFVRDLWVRPDLPAEDTGSELVRLMEEEAREQGCSLVWVETYSFMTRSFYEKLGFLVVGTVTDQPPGKAFYTMRKDLKADYHV